MSSKTVAVTGGGYGGAAVAKALDEHTDVVLIEPKDAFVHAAGSLRALVRPDRAGNTFFPYDGLLRRGKVIREYAASVDPDGVTLAPGARVEADYLALATRSGYAFPAKADTDDTAEALARPRATHEELAGADRVLIAGAGPVGLELAGEIKAVWPDKGVTIVDPGAELLPGFDPALRADLHRQLSGLGVEVRLSTTLTEEPPADPGKAKTFTVATTGADAQELTADIWFRCHGVRTNSGYLSDGRLTPRTPKGQVPVTESLNVRGHDHVYALGDLTDLAEAKTAGYAMRHAEVVAQNILARTRDEEPTATYRPSPVPAVPLPLGPAGGVGQLPTEGGAEILPPETVAEHKGRTLFTDRFADLFNTAPQADGT
ncbi:NAD(P)/FAD-dependent oxidoreductase [Streptomyces flavofungini]|uniref:FAD-dependent oxidoreductase n=1 Tax=Streptomyces flavofungini TaxID=68200 RepID=A0ABS0X6B2_9ACTN|nr:FAD-dependent oxidoreductase [Streptomyces flavofungini]MBJ3808745.1 FAD-dependent oxidoreductase [Streptomyces flavofungini]GHC49664.1 hypothetical protein GCM10010349_13980 [Streptomyces flavofungini]